MVCVDGTVSSFLEGSPKVVYLGYRRFLVEGDRHRSKFYSSFDGKFELHSALVQRDMHYVFNMVRTIQVTHGKMMKDGKNRNIDKASNDGVPFINSKIHVAKQMIKGKVMASHPVPSLA